MLCVEKFVEIMLPPCVTVYAGSDGHEAQCYDTGAGARRALCLQIQTILATPFGGVESMLVNQLSIVMDTYLLIFTLVGHTALGPTIPSRL